MIENSQQKVANSTNTFWSVPLDENGNLLVFPQIKPKKVRFSELIENTFPPGQYKKENDLFPEIPEKVTNSRWDWWKSWCEWVNDLLNVFWDQEIRIYNKERDKHNKEVTSDNLIIKEINQSINRFTKVMCDHNNYIFHNNTNLLLSTEPVSVKRVGNVDVFSTRGLNYVINPHRPGYSVSISTNGNYSFLLNNNQILVQQNKEIWALNTELSAFKVYKRGDGTLAPCPLIGEDFWLRTSPQEMETHVQSIKNMHLRLKIQQTIHNIMSNNPDRAGENVFSEKIFLKEWKSTSWEQRFHGRKNTQNALQQYCDLVRKQNNQIFTKNMKYMKLCQSYNFLKDHVCYDRPMEDWTAVEKIVHLAQKKKPVLGINFPLVASIEEAKLKEYELGVKKAYAKLTESALNMENMERKYDDDDEEILIEESSEDELL